MDNPNEASGLNIGEGMRRAKTEFAALLDKAQDGLNRWEQTFGAHRNGELAKLLSEEPLSPAECSGLFDFLGEGFNEDAAKNYHGQEKLTICLLVCAYVCSKENFGSFLRLAEERINKIDPSFHPIWMARAVNDLLAADSCYENMGNAAENLGQYLKVYCKYPQFNGAALPESESVCGYLQAYRVLDACYVFSGYGLADGLFEMSEALFEEGKVSWAGRGPSCDNDFAYVHLLAPSFPACYLEALDEAPSFNLADIVLLDGRGELLEELAKKGCAPDAEKILEFLAALMERNPDMDEYHVETIRKRIAQAESCLISGAVDQKVGRASKSCAAGGKKKII